MKSSKTTRLFLVGTSFSAEQTVLLSNEQSHYLGNVLRLQKNQSILLANGQQGLWTADWIEKNRVLLKECVQPQPPAPPALHVFFSPFKRQDWLLEKGTELGVTDFHPVLCRHSVVRTVSRPRWEKIILEACEQSRRLDIPRCHDLVSLPALSFSEKGNFFIAHEKALQNLGQWVGKLSWHLPKGLFVGPEGGFHPQELDQLREQPWSFVKLGPFTLRCETAAVAGIACLVALETNALETPTLESCA